MALTPGARFGSYEIVEPIGAGGMGEVWRAKDTELQPSRIIVVENWIEEVKERMRSD